MPNLFGIVSEIFSGKLSLLPNNKTHLTISRVSS